MSKSTSLPGGDDRLAPGRPASPYPGWFRFVEIASIVSFFSMSAGLGWKVWPHVAGSPWLIAGSLLVGFLAADFTSGFVHWLGDTWGSVDMPILGKSLIRPFREHHVDQKAMTRHDYIETNGANCMISLPWAFGALWIPFDPGKWQAVGIAASVSIGSMIFFVMLTNQFHKWAHLEEEELSPVVRWLQRAHLILPPEHHRIHHAPPHAVHYSITTGWLNRPLHAIGFYRRAEWLVTAVTGLVPRKGDDAR